MKIDLNFPKRWIIGFMCFWGSFIAYAMRAGLSMTITEMVTRVELEKNNINESEVCTEYPLILPTNSSNHPYQGKLYNWTSSQQVNEYLRFIF